MRLAALAVPKSQHRGQNLEQQMSSLCIIVFVVVALTFALTIRDLLTLCQHLSIVQPCTQCRFFIPCAVLVCLPFVALTTHFVAELVICCGWKICRGDNDKVCYVTRVNALTDSPTDTPTTHDGDDKLRFSVCTAALQRRTMEGWKRANTIY